MCFQNNKGSGLDNLLESISFCSIEVASGFSIKKIRDVLNGFDSSTEAWKNLCNSSSLQQSLEKGKIELDKIFSRSAESLERLSFNTHIINLNDPLYPNNLKFIKEPPRVLFVRGNVGALSRNGVAIVGSRNATEDGKKRAYKAARLVGKLGLNINSGLAIGIDTSAHLGALQNNFHTIAVIGTPIDQYYPKENQNLQDIISREGTLVSQFSPLHPVNRFNFPTRNITMSGLSLATVIVEAGETSGALIQAKHCLSQKRCLFIMKNQVDKKELKWPKEYIEKGGLILNEIDDLTTALNKLKITPECGQKIVTQTSLF